MKVRIGAGLGPDGAPDGFAAAVDLLEAARIDSLWLPEMVYGPLVDPFAGMPRGPPSRSRPAAAPRCSTRR